MIDWTIPIKLVSPNVQEHWRVKHQRNKMIACVLKAKWQSENVKVTLPCTVTLTRQAPREFDYQNFVFSLKGIQDILADLLIPSSSMKLCEFTDKHGNKKYKKIRINMGKTDADPRIQWVYKQEKMSKVNQVRIQIIQSVQ